VRIIKKNVAYVLTRTIGKRKERTRTIFHLHMANTKIEKERGKTFPIILWSPNPMYG
jgi:hypothetical protein